MGILWLVLLEGKVKNERSEYWLQSKKLAVQVCIIYLLINPMLWIVLVMLYGFHILPWKESPGSLWCYPS